MADAAPPFSSSSSASSFNPADLPGDTSPQLRLSPEQIKYCYDALAVLKKKLRSPAVITQEFDRLKNEEGTLWMPESVLSAGLMTFYTSTKPLDKSWHVMGLGYNPNISPDEIRNAAVIHFNGNMKPWLDIAMNQYKNL